MNSQWKAFLTNRSAVVDDSNNVRFPNAPVEAGCALTDLSQLGQIAVSGADAESFLQGQVTNDLRELSENHTHLSGLCSPKGRLLASFRVIRLDHRFYLQLPRTQLDAVLKRLGMFVLRAKVELSDESDNLILIGITGDCAEALLAEHFDSLPTRQNDLTRKGDLRVIRMPGPITRFQVLGPEPAMEDLWDLLATKARVVNPDHWSLMNIRAGVPTVYPETTDAFVPQMANMQLIDGVSFTKGCYTGQEVVARMQYLGKLKRRMYLAEVAANHPPAPGDELHSAATSSQQATGRVVDACAVGADRYELLVIVEISAVGANDVRLRADGPPLTFKEPPYGFPART